MEDKISSGILKGRPFGGLCILLNKFTFCRYKSISCCIATENFILCKADNLLLINVYFPSGKSTTDVDRLHCVLDDVIVHVEDLPHTAAVLGGDLNCNILLNSKFSDLINLKLKSIGLQASHNYIKESNSKLYSFCVESRNAYSLIDFFFCPGCC